MRNLEQLRPFAKATAVFGLGLFFLGLWFVANRYVPVWYGGFIAVLGGLSAVCGMTIDSGLYARIVEQQQRKS